MENYQTRVTPEKEAAVKALKDEFAQYDSFSSPRSARVF